MPVCWQETGLVYIHIGHLTLPPALRLLSVVARNSSYTHQQRFIFREDSLTSISTLPTDSRTTKLCSGAGLPWSKKTEKTTRARRKQCVPFGVPSEQIHAQPDWTCPLDAEILLCTGILTSWIGSKNQVSEAQEIAKDLLTRSITCFEAMKRRLQGRYCAIGDCLLLLARRRTERGTIVATRSTEKADF